MDRHQFLKLLVLVPIAALVPKPKEPGLPTVDDLINSEAELIDETDWAAIERKMLVYQGTGRDGEIVVTDNATGHEYVFSTSGGTITAWRDSWVCRHVGQGGFCDLLQSHCDPHRCPEPLA